MVSSAEMKYRRKRGREPIVQSTPFPPLRKTVEKSLRVPPLNRSYLCRDKHPSAGSGNERPDSFIGRGLVKSRIP
jgi:hypothetical protein